MLRVSTAKQGPIQSVAPEMFPEGYVLLSGETVNYRVAYVYVEL